MGHQLFEKNCLIFAIALFIISFIIIYYNSVEFLSSVFAALLTALLGWVSYVIVRLAILAFKK